MPAVDALKDPVLDRAAIAEKKELIRLELMRRRGLSSLTFFMTSILGYPPLDDVHEEVASFLSAVSAGPHRGLLLLPRGHLKSTEATISYSVWRIIRDPDIRILISNAVLENSKGFLREIKQHFERNDLLRKLYGDFANQDEKWSEMQILVRKRRKVLKEPTIQVTSTDKSVVSQHYDLIIGDDIVNRETVNTKEQRHKSVTYYRDLLDLLEPGGDMFFIGTRWHFDDLYGHIIGENARTKSFLIMRRTVWRDEENRIPLFKKFTPEYIDSLRLEKGAYSFSCQYMNSPIDEETADFSRGWINRFDVADLREIPHQLFITVDPAITKTETSDNTGIVVNAVSADGKWRVVRAYRMKLNPTELLDELFSLRRVYGNRIRGFGIEAGMFQEALAPALAEWEKKMGRKLFIEPLKHNRRRKEERIRGLVPKMERGEILLSEHCDDLVEELLSFPRSNTDDILDALAYQLDFATPSGIPAPGQTRQQLMTPIKPIFQKNL